MGEAQIVYYLNHGGRMEQPHLIEVPHCQDAGLRLKDVKKRLALLRGQGMPYAFSWSYKRSYKDEYIWHDLLDEDLLFPFCGNEYILQGSENSYDWQGKCKCGSKLSAKKYSDEHSNKCQVQKVREDVSRSQTPEKKVNHDNLKAKENYEKDKRQNLFPACQANRSTSDRRTETNLTSSNALNVNRQVMDTLSQAKSGDECILDNDMSSDNILSEESSVRNFVDVKVYKVPVSELESIDAVTEQKGKLTDANAPTSKKDNSEVQNQKLDHKPQEVAAAPSCQIVEKSLSPETRKRPIKHQSSSKKLVDDQVSSIKPKQLSSSIVFRQLLSCGGIDTLTSPSLQSKVTPVRFPHLEQKIGQLNIAQSWSFPKPTSKPSYVDNRDIQLFEKEKSRHDLHAKEKPSPLNYEPSVETVQKVKDGYEDSSTEKPDSNLSTSCDLRKCEEATVNQNGVCTNFDDERCTPCETSKSSHDSSNFKECEDVAVIIKQDAANTDMTECTPTKLRKHSQNFPKGEETKQIIENTYGVKSAPNKFRDYCDESPVRDKYKLSSNRKSIRCAEALFRELSPNGREESVLKIEVNPTDQRSPPDRSSGHQQALDFVELPKSDTCILRSPIPGKNNEARSARKQLGTRASMKNMTANEDSDYERPGKKSKEHDEGKDVNNNMTISPSAMQKLSNDTKFLTRSLSKETRKDASPMFTIVKCSASRDTIPLKSPDSPIPCWDDMSPPKKELKSRDDRPLTPGRSKLDWEKTLQEVANISVAPPDFRQFLQECTQCGRTFKPESLKVHMRGCRGQRSTRASMSSMPRKQQNV